MSDNAYLLIMTVETTALTLLAFGVVAWVALRGK